MPNVATVRIFSIDGTLVRKLDKNDTEQFLKWDLRNSSDLPVASGPYVAYVEAPDMEGSKTLFVYCTAQPACTILLMHKFTR